MILRDPDQTAEFRRNLIQVFLLGAVFVAGLSLLRLPHVTFAILAVAVVSTIAVRAFGPGELDSAHEYALIVATEFTDEVVRVLAVDPQLANGWWKTGVRTDLLTALTSNAAAVAADKVRQAYRRREPVWLHLSITAAAAMVATVVLKSTTPTACMRLPTSTVLLVVAAAMVSVLSRVAIRIINERQRRSMRAHLAEDPPNRVRGELHGLLAPVESRRRSAMAAMLNQLAGVQPPPTLLPVGAAIRLLPSMALGATAAIALVGLTTRC